MSDLKEHVDPGPCICGNKADWIYLSIARHYNNKVTYTSSEEFVATYYRICSPDHKLPTIYPYEGDCLHLCPSCFDEITSLVAAFDSLTEKQRQQDEEIRKKMVVDQEALQSANEQIAVLKAELEKKKKEIAQKDNEKKELLQRYKTKDPERNSKIRSHEMKVDEPNSKLEERERSMDSKSPSSVDNDLSDDEDGGDEDRDDEEEEEDDGNSDNKTVKKGRGLSTTGIPKLKRTASNSSELRKTPAPSTNPSAAQQMTPGPSCSSSSALPKPPAMGRCSVDLPRILSQKDFAPKKIKMEVKATKGKPTDGEKEYVCPQCAEKFRKKSELTKHKKVTHFKVLVQNINKAHLKGKECTHCGATVGSPAGLLTHLYTEHKSEYPYDSDSD